jgi:DNA-binding beta-propeller fold protein YncE
MGLGLMASPAEAAPFAYVTNSYSNTVSVIATATKITVCRELKITVCRELKITVCRERGRD